MAARSMVAIAREISTLKSSPLGEAAKAAGIRLLQAEADALLRQMELDLSASLAAVGGVQPPGAPFPSPAAGPTAAPGKAR